MDVEISPGATALTRMPYSASSIAMTLVRSLRLPLEEQYAEAPVCGICSCTEVKLIILPPFLLATMALAILLAGGVAQAIINGQLDMGPNAHPYVGALVTVPPSGEFKGQRIPRRCYTILPGRSAGGG
jgi:hypothetical protein